MPPTEPLGVLLAIATDLLAQTEAQHRTATRLERAVRQLSREVRERASHTPSVEVIREQLRAMRDLFDAERALIDELEREVAGAGS